MARTGDRIGSSARKAWRFIGEMEEIAATLSDTGQPDGFHAAAAQVYRRRVHFKQAGPGTSLEEVLAALRADQVS